MYVYIYIYIYVCMCVCANVCVCVCVCVYGLGQAAARGETGLASATLLLSFSPPLATNGLLPLHPRFNKTKHAQLVYSCRQAVYVFFLGGQELSSGAAFKAFRTCYGGLKAFRPA